MSLCNRISVTMALQRGVGASRLCWRDVSIRGKHAEEYGSYNYSAFWSKAPMTSNQAAVII